MVNTRQEEDEKLLKLVLVTNIFFQKLRKSKLCLKIYELIENTKRNSIPDRTGINEEVKFFTNSYT